MVTLDRWLALILAVGLLVLGYYAGGRHLLARGRHFRFNGYTVVTILAVIATVVAAWAALWWVSPTLFARVSSILPQSVQESIMADYFFRGDIGIWVAIVIAAVLWWWRANLSSSGHQRIGNY